jgi:HAD superfamily hydrolase (TIGR01509 family)
MKKKTILFDFDGVIVDTHYIHYKSFRDSLLTVLGDIGNISYTEYILFFDGVPTYSKIDKFTKYKNLKFDKNTIDTLYYNKQKITLELYSDVKPDNRVVEILNYFKINYKIACCSNSNKIILTDLLTKLGIYDLFDVVLSSDDVLNKKPHSDIYSMAMEILNSNPTDTYIIEDTSIGLTSARLSGAKSIFLNNYENLTIDFILNAIKKLEHNPNMNIYHNNNLNLVIPMAGDGKRFMDAGYLVPKPLIPIPKNSMIYEVYTHLNITSNCIFIVKKSHKDIYNIDKTLDTIHPNCTIINVEKTTQGSVETILLSEPHINNDNPLIISNCDNIVIWDSVDFMYMMNKLDADGGIVCFKDSDPKWSFVKLNDDNQIIEVAEKKPISDNATSGIYYWKRGSDFVKYAKQMIAENYRVNGEFYTAPVYNFAINDGKKIYPYFIEKSDMWGVGDPESLDYFLKNYNL